MPKPSENKPKAGQKISLAELHDLLRDPNADPKSFAQYFKLDEAASGPFAPKVVLNPDLVEVDVTTPQGVARSAAAMAFANGLARARREGAFRRKLIFGYDGPIIVSEGDSWFQFPLLLADVIDVLSETYAIASLDAAGDTLQQMIDQDEYLARIHDEDASILLFSGGGNDVLGGGKLEEHLRRFDANLTAAQHIKSSFTGLIDNAIGQFDQIFRRVAREAPGVQIITHGYDYAIPASGKWLGKPMESLGIVDGDFQRAIIREMIDRFALAMSRLAARHSHVHFLDNRKTIKANEWHDELHPVDSGYAKIAAAFDRTIKAIAAKPRSTPKTATIGAAPRPRGGAMGRSRSAPAPALAATMQALSLHIGLNEVDPAHYGSKCELGGCHADAHDMVDLAKRKGYSPMATLLDKDGTVANLKAALKESAAKLEAGGIFFLTYSGHGGQMPDFSGDEPDGTDETWCLFDRQFLDDEIYELWRPFKEGVRVLVISDSCHSGTVLRSTAAGMLSMDVHAPGVLPFKPRTLPPAARAFSVNEHRAFYRDLARTLPGTTTGLAAAVRPRALDRPLAATVRLFSGCQDNQTSADIGTNGLFTFRMLGVLDRGFAGNYESFYKEVLKSMPADQTPNHWVIGRKDPAFDSQQPFEV